MHRAIMIRIIRPEGDKLSCSLQSQLDKLPQEPSRDEIADLAEVVKHDASCHMDHRPEKHSHERHVALLL